MPTTNDYEFIIGDSNGKPMEDEVYYPSARNALFAMTPEQSAAGAHVYSRPTGNESASWSFAN